MNHDVCDKFEVAARSIKEGFAQATEYYGESEFLIVLFGEMIGHLTDAIRTLAEAMKEAKQTPSEDMIVLSRALEGLYGGTITDGLRDASRLIAAKTLFDAALPAGDDEESPDVS